MILRISVIINNVISPKYSLYMDNDLTIYKLILYMMSLECYLGENSLWIQFRFLILGILRTFVTCYFLICCCCRLFSFLFCSYDEIVTFICFFLCFFPCKYVLIVWYDGVLIFISLCWAIMMWISKFRIFKKSLSLSINACNMMISKNKLKIRPQFMKSSNMSIF